MRRSRGVQISKHLSQILRRRAPDFHIDIQPDGFCLLQQVLACPCLAALRTTQKDVEDIVTEDAKHRFELTDQRGNMMIRAVQGHSLKVVEDNQLLRQIDPDNLPDCCVHGTYWKHFESIKFHGLLAGGRKGRTYRNHVHFSSFHPGDRRVISGMRSDSQIAIWIDLQKAIDDGIPFYWSTNQVILSPGRDGVLPPQYFSYAQDLMTMQTLSLH